MGLFPAEIGHVTGLFGRASGSVVAWRRHRSSRTFYLTRLVYAANVPSADNANTGSPSAIALSGTADPAARFRKVRRDTAY